MPKDERWRGWLPDEAIREADGPIYHYTDSGGLLGAVANHELWATEASGMNDVSEVVQGWQFIRRWAADQDPTDRIISMVASEAGTDDEGDSDSRTRSRDGVFMCCASLRGDDANQWRLYAAGGRGYAMELNPGVPLAALVDGERGPDPDPQPGSISLRFDYVPVTPWLHVLYTDEQKSRALEGLVKTAHEKYREFERAAADWDDADRRFEHRDFMDSLARELGRVAQLMKSEGFQGEHEVRVVATDWQALTARFRSTSFGVVRYSRLVTDPSAERSWVAYAKDLGSAKTIPLRSVTMGPLIRAQNNRETVRAMLDANQFGSCVVRESDVPLGRC